MDNLATIERGLNSPIYNNYACNEWKPEQEDVDDWVYITREKLNSF